MHYHTQTALIGIIAVVALLFLASPPTGMAVTGCNQYSNSFSGRSGLDCSKQGVVGGEFTRRTGQLAFSPSDVQESATFGPSSSYTRRISALETRQKKYRKGIVYEISSGGDNPEFDVDKWKKRHGQE